MTPEENPVESRAEPPEGPSPFYRAAWGFYLVLAVLGVLWIGFHLGDIPLAFFLDAGTWWLDLLYGLGAAWALIGSWWLASRHIAAMRRVEEAMREMIGPLQASEVFALALMSGFAEELFFRGAMQSSWGWPWALLIFTLLHTGPERSFRLWTVFAFSAGALFTWLTLERGNLLPAIVAHVTVNGVNLYRLTGTSPADLEGA